MYLHGLSLFSLSKNCEIVSTGQFIGLSASGHPYHDVSDNIYGVRVFVSTEYASYVFERGNAIMMGPSANGGVRVFVSTETYPSQYQSTNLGANTASSVFGVRVFVSSAEFSNMRIYGYPGGAMAGDVRGVRVISFRRQKLHI